jgi:hypothetical protein
MVGFRAIFLKWHIYPSKTLIREKNARVWSVCSRQSKEIQVLILWGTYNISNI